MNVKYSKTLIYLKLQIKWLMFSFVSRRSKLISPFLVSLAEDIFLNHVMEDFCNIRKT